MSHIIDRCLYFLVTYAINDHIDCFSCILNLNLKNFSYLQSIVLDECIHTRTNHSISDGQNRE